MKYLDVKAIFPKLKIEWRTWKTEASVFPTTTKIDFRLAVKKIEKTANPVFRRNLIIGKRATQPTHELTLETMKSCHRSAKRNMLKHLLQSADYLPKILLELSEVNYALVVGN
jgi:hypothetical protein